MLSKTFMKVRYFSFTLILIGMIISSCRKPDEFPVEPIITFKSVSTIQNLQGYDAKIIVVLGFTDGDGDIGYKQPGENDPIFDDTTSIYFSNYFARYSILRNGVWLTTESPILPPRDSLEGRIPYLTPDSKNKSLKGEISCEFFTPFFAIQDTFRLDLYIYDRSLHKSNVVTTAEFIINNP